VLKETTAAGPIDPAAASLAERIVSADPDDCAARIRMRGMVVRHDQMSRGTYAAMLDTVILGDLRVSRSDYSPAITSHGSPPAGTYALMLPVSSARGVFFNHQPVSDPAIGMVRPADEFLFFRPARFECIVMFPEAAAIDRLAEGMFGRTLAGLAGPGRHLLVADAALAGSADRIAQLCRAIAAAWTPGGPAARPDRGRSLEAALVDEVLRVMQPPQPVRGWSARDRIVRRAWEIVEQDDQGSITVAELCVRLGVPIRTLDDAFRTCLDISPKRFINTLRLNGVRRCLSRPRDDTTVTEVATRFGFFHFGHFSGHYARLFGELPSQTLRRARS